MVQYLSIRVLDYGKYNKNIKKELCETVSRILEIKEEKEYKENARL